MYIPTIPHEKAVDEDGVFTKPWSNYVEQQAQNMQLCLSDEGYVIPSVSSASSSVTPAATGGQLSQVQATYGQQTGVQLGTLVYDPNTNQLKVLLSDGVFHPVTTT